MTSQEFSDFSLDDSCDSDMDVASFTKLPRKRPRRVVKTGVSLFYLLALLKLVAAVKRTNITPANF